MEKKVAVIVPVYKVDKSLVSKCIESLLRQTYHNLEIIVVDDGNDKEYREFLKSFVNSNSGGKVRIISHDKNKGLYQARMTGVYNSDSDYVAFVDADDSVSIDWFRLLVKRANEHSADIVMGNTICEDENHCKYVLNRGYSITDRDDLEGKEIYDFLVRDCGLDFSIHTVWNKLYERSVWDRSRHELETINKHLVMTEDILFSYVLLFYAKRMSFANCDGYFYYRNPNSSTLNTTGFLKCKKNIEDLALVFGAVESFLKTHKIYAEYERYWLEWKDRYYRWWSENVSNACAEGNNEQVEIVKLFMETFGKDKYEYADERDAYFDSMRTTWNNAYENIKSALVSEQCKIVSFDMFDTLIVRPVLYSEDVYEFVLNEIDTCSIDKEALKEYRKMAESFARKSISIKYAQYEDITISEIYDAMHERYSVPVNLCNELKNKEIEIEIEFAIRRNAGAGLYELAKYLGKKIYITSDMYLEEDTIKKMLLKNGYEEPDCLLLSSSERLLKSTGHLFDKIITENECGASEVIHIGDNWEVDAVLPTKKGMRTFFIPKTKDILFNYLGDAYTGNAIGRAVDNTESIVDYSKYFDNLAVRCIYATIANRLFDNPYVSYNSETDYNSDPFYLGVMALGPYMLGVSKWLIELAQKKHYETIHFSSRDGYYVKKIFDLLSEATMVDVRSNYLYTSRKAFIPIEIHKKEMINRIFNACSFYTNTPESIIKRYSKVLEPLTPNMIKLYKENGFFMNKSFESKDEFARFLNILGDNQFSGVKAQMEFRLCQKYLRKNITQNDAVFDLGYSGKLHKDIIDALGYNIDGIYISKGGYDAIKRIDDKHLNIISYYDFKPSMEGIVNEYILSDRGPSCIGYEESTDGVEPILEEKREDYVGDYAVNEINRGAYEFVKLFISYYIDKMDMIKVQPMDTSLLYEKFLLSAKKHDMEIFESCKIEDEFYGGIAEKPLLDIWNWQLNDRHIRDTIHYCGVEEQLSNVVESVPNNLEENLYKEKMTHKSKIAKAIYWYLVNKEEFKRRIHNICKVIFRRG